MARSSRKPRRVKRAQGRNWSGAVTRNSNALDLESSVFTERSPRQVALSLKRSAERSRAPQGHALSIGDVDADLLHEPGRENLPESRKRVLRRAKDELRKAFGRA